jgi:heat shock protein HslJ
MASDGICKIRKGISIKMNQTFSLRRILGIATLFMCLQNLSLLAYADDNQFHQQAWELITLDRVAIEEKAKPYFIFSEDGNVYGYGACNYFAGKFKSTIDGEFLITQLKRTNETCENDDDIEVKLMASMLMSNRFIIEAGQLKLMSDQQLTVAFEPKADVNRSELIKQATLLKARKKSVVNERRKTKKLKGKKATVKQTNEKSKSSEKTIKGKNAKGKKSNAEKVSRPKKSRAVKASAAKGKTSKSSPKTKVKQVKAK